VEGPPPELLPRPPEEAARLLALFYLDQAAAARPRLTDDTDSEALHDFRVALRRLRSTLGSYSRELAPSVPKKLAKRLRRLAGATGPGRDAEVQIEWLREQRPHLSSHHVAGHAWLLGRLTRRRDDAYSELIEEICGEFDELAHDLRQKISIYRAEIHLGEARATFADRTAEILERRAGRLAERLGRIGGADDPEHAHRARISAKKLRYLLDPLVASDPHPHLVQAAKRLKTLQEVLGELHDAHLLEDELAEAASAAAADRALRLFELALSEAPDEKRLRLERRRPHEAGVLALARRNRARRDALYGRFAGDWMDGRAQSFLEELERVGKELRTATHGAVQLDEPEAPQERAAAARATE
jgi:CHAD domain-containing protein